MKEKLSWRVVPLREALDHAVGRTISGHDWEDRITFFTDGTAVQTKVETYSGSSWTGAWTEEDFAIGEPYED